MEENTLFFCRAQGRDNQGKFNGLQYLPQKMEWLYVIRDCKSLKSDLMSFDCTPSPQTFSLHPFYLPNFFFPKSLAPSPHLQTFISLGFMYIVLQAIFFLRKCGSLRQAGRVDNSRLKTNPDHRKIKWWTESPKDISSLLQGPDRRVLPKQIRRRTPSSSEEILRGQRLRKTQKTKI